MDRLETHSERLVKGPIIDLRRRIVLLLLLLSSCAMTSTNPKPTVLTLASGAWKEWSVWPDHSGRKLVLVYELNDEDSDQNQGVLLVDVSSGTQTEIGQRVLPPPREEKVTDVRWSPTDQQIALETAGDEHGLVYVVDLRSDTVKALNIEGTAGSRSPRWDASGHWLYFVPGLLSLDMTEDGLFGYELSSGRVWKVLSDMFVAEGFAIAGGRVLGVMPFGSAPGARLFSFSLPGFNKHAKEVARWEAAESRFVSTVTQGKDR